MKKQILIFSNRKISSAPRILREIEALKGIFDIHLTGQELQLADFSNYHCIYTFRSIKDKLTSKFKQLTRQKEQIPTYSKLEAYVRKHDIQLIIVHEPHMLELAVKLKQQLGVKIVFNAHEYHPLEFEDIPNWLETEGNFHLKIYNTYLSKVDLLVNVCDSIRTKCSTEFGVDSIVIPNATSYNNLSIKINTIDKIRLIHHGVNLPSRKIEKMIEIVSKLGNEYTLDLMLTNVDGNENYMKKIDRIVANTSNVKLRKPVKTIDISREINNYDIGLFYLEPVNFNYKFALPNKLFEFMQARLAIVVSPSYEMKFLVEKYQMGVSSKDFSVDSMVETIKNLTREKIMSYKMNSDKAAKIENAEKYNQIYLEQILSII